MSKTDHTVSFTGGPKGMLGSAIGCGILLGVFEGVGVLVGRCVSLPPRFLCGRLYVTSVKLTEAARSPQAVRRDQQAHFASGELTLPSFRLASNGADFPLCK